MLKKFFLLFALALLLLPVACTDEESDLGVSLNDPFTLYNGVRDTVSFSAQTLYDDSLSASGYAAAVLGNHTDPVFGTVHAIVYSQISAPKEGVRITDEVVFDSVVMTLVVDTVYPVRADSTPIPLHVIVKQLAEPLLADSAYYTGVPLSESSDEFFNGMVTYYADSLRLRMNESIYPKLRQTCSQADFIQIIKGISIKLDPIFNANDMLTIDFSATATRMTMYYHTPSAQNLKYEFIINSGAAHSMYYRHEYAGTPLAVFESDRNAAIAGDTRLYLEPLGGTKVRINMNDYIVQFHKQHPNAVVHYAELRLPVDAVADTSMPVRILALKRNSDGTSAYVTDANVLTNNYTYSGFDGYYNRAKHCYRLRLTRHLQELLRQGQDYGTELIIDARRSLPFRTVINGTATDNPIMLDFIYSE